MLISESFASFKAKQKNVQWSVSAISENNELVVSLWDQSVASGEPANNLGNTFHPKKNWVGKVTLWDGDNFEIEFSQRK